MEAVTFPQQEIITLISESFVPLRLAADSKPYSDDFKVTWTPTLIVIGSDKTEHHRTVGFLETGEFKANALLGAGKYYFDNDRLEEALILLDKVQQLSSEVIPEAIFLQGVARFKQGHDPQYLKKVYEFLRDNHPDSQWTQRAYPYRLL